MKSLLAHSLRVRKATRPSDTNAGRTATAQGISNKIFCQDRNLFNYGRKKNFLQIVETVTDEVERFFLGVTEMVDDLFDLSEEITQIQTQLLRD